MRGMVLKTRRSQPQLPKSEHRISTALPNKGTKQTSAEHIGRSHLIPGVRRTLDVRNRTVVKGRGGCRSAS
jgi:hypothetical protein